MAQALLFALCLVSVAQAQICHPHEPNAYKVRLSIKTALGDKAYNWNENEQYLFRATIAFAMRQYLKNEIFRASNVLTCNETQRVSFWFVVTSPENPSVTIPENDVAEAIRLNRHRINNAFLLSDKTLQFIGIPPTLSPPVESSLPVWLILFGVVLGLVVIGIIFMIVTGIRQRKRLKKPVHEEDPEEKLERGVIENGIACQTIEEAEGIKNGAYEHDDDKLTQL
ncbi:collectrin [Latimeria chalumnae]|uniref:collectrin n=1 Tax=Latimeria chalumnae TaxID=7897 RepID=UPI0003C1A52F|nr:PREDICTED: collectrin [Latimeria chalumnae]|eukprot:XP_005997909.1 PREDICTED: collectrin [Latimeria chalumnae]